MDANYASASTAINDQNFVGNSSGQTSTDITANHLLAGTMTSSNSTNTTTNCSMTQAMQNYAYYTDPNYYQQYYQQYYAYGYGQQQYFSPFYYPTTATTTVTTYNPAYLTAQSSYPGLNSTATTEISNQTTEQDDDDDDDPTIAKPNKPKLSNVLNYACNEKMGLNPLIYTNILQSPYFKNNLILLKNYNDVINEIFYNVKHLEPWEKGSRKVSGQVGMCGSVRGVGAGGIISTPFCILYKLFTLRLTRKQVNSMLRHKDSAYIRALGFMYIRYTQRPQDLWQWFESYLNDEEQVDPKAGGGSPMTIGEMVRHFLTKNEWFSTVFPRVPRQIQIEIDKKLKNYDDEIRKERKGHYNEELNNEDDYEEGEYHENTEKDYRSTEHRRHRSHDHHNRNNSRPKRSRSKSPGHRHRSNKRHDDYRKSSRH